MKKILLILGIVFLPFLNYAQLTSPNIVSYPCYLAGGMSGVVVADSVPGATGYEWVSNIGHVNVIWFPNAPGPAQTSVPTVNIFANLSQQVYEICVRAVNATDTSAWTCVQIMGIFDPPVLVSTNNPVGVPGDSGYYSVVYPSLCPPLGYSWTLTGDVTFNNGSQNFQTSGTGVNLNFGLNFISGTLCVAALSPVGSLSDTVCMLITAPVGLPESNFSEPVVFYQSESNQLVIEISSIIPENLTCILTDITGRDLFSEKQNLTSGLNKFSINTGSLSDGIYLFQLNSTDYHFTKKVFIRK